MSSIKIGEVLVKQGLLRPDQLNQALEEQKKSGGARLTQIIISLGFLKDNQILRAAEKFYQVPGVEVASFQIDEAVIALIPRDVCDKHTLIPIQKAGNTLVVAFSDPGNIIIKEDLRYITRHRIQAVVGTETSIASAIDRCYGGLISQKTLNAMSQETADDDIGAANVEIIDEVGAGSEDAPIIKFVNAILADAIKRKVSDIHFEPYEKRYRVRFRIDGNLVEATAPPAGTAAAIGSRIKIMSKLDIAEKRRPQDGRLKVRTSKGKEMDFRVSVLPTLFGEKVVLRLLDKSNLQLDMTKLGFEPDDLKLFKSMIQLPQGMVLITGPTGSGKTTTIYSALYELNQPDVNISTAEDPVEFNLEGINQVQMNSEMKPPLDFTLALKSFLRQDPDIIMVGEMRDLETAEIGFKAASTGHLVVSTLHTNDAPATIVRLTEMGVAPYIITATVNLIVAQRLVGKICENCKQAVEVPSQALVNLGIHPDEVPQYQIFKGRGCPTCNGTGIKGRAAIYELMAMTEKIKDAILKGASAGQLRFLAREQGMRTLRRSALLKLKRGVTTIEEVLNSSVKDI